VITELPVLVPPPAELTGDGNDDHPMRKVTRQVAFDGAWDAERAAKVAELFDGLAPEWHTRFSAERLDPLTDALDRGAVAGRVCLELGSGTGFATAILAERFPLTVAMDLSLEMLRHAPAASAPRVQADASRLPLGDGSVDVLVAVNMLLFPAEVARVLAARGALVWVNSLGDRTPIYLPAHDVAAAMGDGWAGVASSWGQGTWCVLRRA
jgi:SAM-dependent methyltransferase